MFGIELQADATRVEIESIDSAAYIVVTRSTKPPLRIRCERDSIEFEVGLTAHQDPEDPNDKSISWHSLPNINDIFGGI